MVARRLLLTLALLLVVLMTTIPATAFKRTVISDASRITVSSSDVAGLAVAASSGNSVNQVTYAGGQIQVHFGKGFGGSVYALQTSRTQATLAVAADDIKMLNVLRVTNNSGYCQDVAVWVSAGTAVNLTNIYGRSGGLPDTLLGTASRVRRVQPGDQMFVDFWWNATTAVASPGNFTISIKGTQSASCP